MLLGTMKLLLSQGVRVRNFVYLMIATLFLLLIGCVRILRCQDRCIGTFILQGLKVSSFLGKGLSQSNRFYIYNTVLVGSK